MRERRDGAWQVGIFGTFDVANYGDLLFPIVAAAELSRRLGAVELRPFSYGAKAPPDWPYAVTSVSELPERAGELDGALVGGGFIVRFDKDVAPGYGPPTPSIHHPTGYWLTPALIALQHGIPVVWNAPGMHLNDVPAWAVPLLELALAESRYVAVRDGPSRDVLARFIDATRIAVMPDTVFGIARCLDSSRPSADCERLAAVAGLREPYVVVQATRYLDPFLDYVRRHSSAFRDFRFVVLPIGPVLGDHEALVGDDLPGLVRLPTWPSPLVIAEVISRAAAVVGHSYHLAVTAIAFGVPVLSSAHLTVGKFTALADFGAVYPLPRVDEIDPATFVERLRRREPAAAARAAAERLERYWDHVAAIIREGRMTSTAAANRFWQRLPGLLEADAERAAALEAELAAERAAHAVELDERRAVADAREAELQRVIALARTEIVAREDAIDALRASPSMRVTAPLRYLMRNAKRIVGNGGPT